ncbi:sirohydrochlorin chelatase [Microlunatus endophyticus]
MLAHGSRHSLGTASVERLRAAVDASWPAPVRAAYLDLNEPDLTAVACAIRASGHRRATVVPLLFTPAFHARTDAPATVAAARSASGVDLVLTDILGTPDALIPILGLAASDARIPVTGTLVLAAVGSSRPEANAAVVDLADRLTAVRQGPVEVGFATCEPRATDLLARPGVAGVLALFVGHGLLLDKIRAAAAEQGLQVSAPLEDLLAPLVVARAATVPDDHH